MEINKTSTKQPSIIENASFKSFSKQFIGFDPNCLPSSPFQLRVENRRQIAAVMKNNNLKCLNKPIAFFLHWYGCHKYVRPGTSK